MTSEIEAAAERLANGGGDEWDSSDYWNSSQRDEDAEACGEWILSRLAADRAERRPLPNAVKQTTPTNCFRACVATVLGIPIDEVPTSCDGATWDWDGFQRWLSSRGLQAIEISFANGGTIYPVSTPVPCIVTGPSPRECRTGRHAVVGELIGVDGFRLIHDPHPSDLWIDGEPTHATFFVRLAADRTEREERARPITWEWCQANCDEVVRIDGIGCTWRIPSHENYDARLVVWEDMSGSIWTRRDDGDDGDDWDGVPTTWTFATIIQLLDLLRILKGGGK